MPFEGRKFPSSDWWALLGKFKGSSSTPPSFVLLSLYWNHPPGVRRRCLTQAHPSALRGQRHIPVVSLFACIPDPHSWGPAPAPASWPPHLQTWNRWRRSSAAGAAGRAGPAPGPRRAAVAMAPQTKRGARWAAAPGSPCRTGSALGSTDGTAPEEVVLHGPSEDTCSKKLNETLFSQLT